MQITRFLFIAAMLGMLSLLAACKTSLRNDPRYAPLIGKKFKTKEDLFLVEEAEYYDFAPEREYESSREYVPTFEEFKKGNWVNHINGRKFRFFIPAGTEGQISDIVRIIDPEFFTSNLEWYGVLVNPPEGMDLGKSIHLLSDYRDYKDHGDMTPLPPAYIAPLYP